MFKLLNIGDQIVLQRQELQTLFAALRNAGYELIGPTIRGSVIVYDTLSAVYKGS